MATCVWCGLVIRWGDCGWLDEFGWPCCEIRVEGCLACDDGEPHPHEPADDEEGERAAESLEGASSSASLADFRVDTDPDRNSDPYLVCGRCGECVCTIQHDDELSVLVAVAEGHVCGSEGE